MATRSVTLRASVVGTEHVCEAMRAVGIAEIWFASSGVVYGRPARIPTGEGDGPLLPESHYAAAKLAGEALISGFASLYGWRAYAFRFGNTVGPRSNHGVVHDFVVKLLRDPNRLEILGDGTQAKPVHRGRRPGRRNPDRGRVSAAGPDDGAERRDRGDGDG